MLCVGISLRSNERFDFDLIDDRVMSFQGAAAEPTLSAEPTALTGDAAGATAANVDPKGGAR